MPQTSVKQSSHPGSATVDRRIARATRVASSDPAAVDEEHTARHYGAVPDHPRIEIDPSFQRH